MKNRAFTLIELVIVVVIVGILSIIALPKFQRNAVQEAADQITSHIRYTQHLSMINDRYDPDDPRSFAKFWTIQFNHTQIANFGEKEKTWKYSICQDIAGASTSNCNSTKEIAKDPAKSKRLLTGGWSGANKADEKLINKNLNITNKYGITDVSFKNCGRNANQSIMFDNLGKPASKATPTSSRLSQLFFKQPCEITLVGQTHVAVITVQNETGYVDYKITTR